MTSAGLRARLATPAATLAIALLTAAGTGLFFWRLWHPSARFYVYNLPIALPFAAFFLDRLTPRPPPAPAAQAIDALVLFLALLRVFAPPLPYASGHALFTGYAALTARRWPLRATAALVLAQVAFMKVFVTGGVASLLAGLALASIAAALRTAALRRSRARRSPTSPA
jgi:hypothetical protein